LAVRKMSFVRAERRALNTLTSTASRDPRFVTIGRNAPLCWRGIDYGNHKFSEKRKKLFHAGTMRLHIAVNLLAKFDFSRKVFARLFRQRERRNAKTAQVICPTSDPDPGITMGVEKRNENAWETFGPMQPSNR
jgi:hypothetical protein